MDNNVNIGIQIELKKRFSDSTTPNAEYTVFGNFDNMDITSIKKWSEFSPLKYDENCGEWLDKYYVKLLFKNNDNLKNKGFNNSFWVQLNQTTEISKKPNHYYGLYLVSFSKDYVHEHPTLQELQENFADTLISCYEGTNPDEKSKDFFENSYFAINPVLSYFDLAILFNTNDLENVLNIIDKLKMHKEIFNSSLILGQKSIKDTNETPIPTNNNQNVFFSIKLRQKGNFSNDDINNQLSVLFSNYEMNKVYGNSDLLIYHIPVNDAIEQYYENRIFHLSSQFMKNFKKIHSSINLKISSNTGEKQSDTEASTGSTNNITQQSSNSYTESTANLNSKTEITNFKKILNKYDKFQRDNSLSGRIVHGWYELLNLYKASTASPHTFDIKEVMGHSINTTLKCTDDTIEFIKNKMKYSANYNEIIYLFQNLERATSLKCTDDTIKFIKNKMKYSANYNEIIYLFQNLERATSELRNYFSDYLKSISFSDLHLMDGSYLPHKAGVFTTKFLFAYNKIVKDYTDFIIEKEEKKEKYISFLVLSGNCDRLCTIDEFMFLKHYINENTSSYNPLIINIPEKQLYNINATMITLLHECMHKSGERKRSERLDCILEFIANAFSSIVADRLYYPKYQILDELLSNKKLLIDNPNFEQKIEGFSKAMLKGLYNSITNNTVKIFKEYIKPDNNAVLYLHRLKDEILHNLFNDETCKYSIKNTEIQKIIEESFKVEYNNLIDNIKKQYFDDIICDLDTTKLKLTVAKNIFERFSKRLETALNFNQIGVIIDLAIYVFKECYADITALISLKADSVDYLLSFVVDTQNEYRLFPDNYKASIRICTILKVYYQISDISNIKNDFEIGFKNLDFESIDFNTVWDKLEALWNKYNAPFCQHCVQPLNDYLNIIKTEFEGYFDNENNKLAPIQNFYDVAKKQEITNIIDKMYEFWSGLANDE